MKYKGQEVEILSEKPTTYWKGKTLEEARLEGAKLLSLSNGKIVSFPLAYEVGTIEMDDSLKSRLYAECGKIGEDARKVSEEARKAKAAEEEKKRQEGEARKIEAKRQAALLKFSKAKGGFEPYKSYELLGWMAKHCTSLRPAMPDWMEDAFVKRFGDVPRTVVDSKKRTAGGFPMQWGLSMKISFDREVPSKLMKAATSSNKKSIDNVAFVSDLVESFGFGFGRKQDADRILEEIPAEKIEDFMRGYAA